MLWPGSEKSVFHLDPAAGLTDDGLWKDSGPHGLHVTPVNFAAPNYGLMLGPSGAPCIRFDGATQRGYLAADPMARFYVNAPTTDFTFAVVARHTNPAASDRIFQCRAAGVAQHGLMISYSTVDRMGVIGYNVATACQLYDAAGATTYPQRTRVSVYALSMQSLTERYSWQDGSGVATTVANTAASITYDTAVVPTIGSQPGGGGVFFDGDLYFLGLWNFVWSDQESRNFSAYWMDRC